MFWGNFIYHQFLVCIHLNLIVCSKGLLLIIYGAQAWCLTRCYITLFDDILPKGPYPPCLRMADRALLAGYPWFVSMPTGYQVANIFVILLYVWMLLMAEQVSCQTGSDWKRSSFGDVDFSDNICWEKFQSNITITLIFFSKFMRIYVICLIAIFDKVQTV